MVKGQLLGIPNWLKNKIDILSGKTETLETKIETNENAITEINRNTALAKQTLGYECKNLIPYPYFETTHEDRGITWTDSEDGTVTANGTSTGDSYFYCSTRGAKTYFLKNGRYKLTGCPNGGSNTTYYIEVGITENNAWKRLGYDSGNGVEIVINGDDNSDEGAYVQVVCAVYRNNTVSNLTFKPMLRRAEIMDDTYEPYVPSVDTRINELNRNLANVVKTEDVLLKLDTSGYVTLPITVDHALCNVSVYQGDNVSLYAMPRYNTAKTHYIVRVYDNNNKPLVDTTVHFIIKYI